MGRHFMADRGDFLNETKLLLLCKLRLEEVLWVEVEQRRLDEA
jgi:hypothetical protein